MVFGISLFIYLRPRHILYIHIVAFKATTDKQSPHAPKFEVNVFDCQITMSISIVQLFRSFRQSDWIRKGQLMAT